MARSSGKALFSNFSPCDAPVRTRVGLALANTWKKVRTRSASTPDARAERVDPRCMPVGSSSA
jgi:hypothetical protein